MVKSGYSIARTWKLAEQFDYGEVSNFVTVEKNME